MATTPAPAPVRPRAGRWWLLAAVLVAVVCVAPFLRGGGTQPGPHAPGAVSTLAPDPAHTEQRPVAPGAPPPASLPERVLIPDIGVDAPVVGLGLNKDRTVQVPSNPDDAGWFERGPAPGQQGSSVILGHVDSTTGPAVFHRLRELQRADRILVRLENRSVAVFAVTRVRTYANEDFPARRVYAGNPEHAALTVITCGGEYDSARGGYQSNVVVSTRHVSTVAPTSS